MSSASEILPSFLQRLRDDSDNGRHAVQCAFTHSEQLKNSKAHCLWWSLDSESSKVDTVILFIPGNPGLVGFYEPFLDRIHQKSRRGTAILAHAQLGHSPHVESPPLAFTSLNAQTRAVVETIDAIRAYYGNGINLVVIGHSVGSWFTMQALKERSASISGAFLLFPTISHIVKTPNGRKLWWLFRPPFPKILSVLGNRLARYLVSKAVLHSIFRDWPSAQIDVLHDLVVSGPCIEAALSMSNEEMLMIQDLDLVVLNKNKQKIWVFLADLDDWVGEENKRIIVQAMSDEPENVRIVHGRFGIPHAYCINHSEELADQCLSWLEDPHFSN